MRILKIILPKKLRTILLLQIILSIICWRAVVFNKKHPTFYKYFWCAKCVERIKNSSSEETIYIWDKPKGALTGSVGYVMTETYWEYPCNWWIKVKNILKLDFGSPF